MQTAECERTHGAQAQSPRAKVKGKASLAVWLGQISQEDLMGQRNAGLSQPAGNEDSRGEVETGRDGDRHSAVLEPTRQSHFPGETCRLLNLWGKNGGMFYSSCYSWLGRVWYQSEGMFSLLV